MYSVQLAKWWSSSANLGQVNQLIRLKLNYRVYFQFWKIFQKVLHVECSEIRGVIFWKEGEIKNNESDKKICLCYSTQILKEHLDKFFSPEGNSSHSNKEEFLKLMTFQRRGFFCKESSTFQIEDAAEQADKTVNTQNFTKKPDFQIAKKVFQQANIQVYNLSTEQLYLFAHPANRKLVINGAPGGGKTLLCKFKLLELVSKEEKCVLFVPENMKEEYQHQFINENLKLELVSLFTSISYSYSNKGRLSTRDTKTSRRRISCVSRRCASILHLSAFVYDNPRFSIPHL